jgi:anti-anti-sigma factor
MEVSSKEEKGALIVNITGRVDAVTAPDLEKQLSDLVDTGKNILVTNLGDLEYISSAGLRVILSTAKKLKAAQGDLILVGLHGTVKEVFEISGFISIFKVFDTVEAALDQL